MLTEVTPTVWGIKVNGKIIYSNLLSQRLAENLISSLPENEKLIAEIIPMTQEGKVVLLG